MKQLKSQTHLTPDRSGPNVHQQKKSVTKGLVEVAGSVCYIYRRESERVGTGAGLE